MSTDARPGAPSTGATDPGSTATPTPKATVTTLRTPTLETLGLGSVLEIFRNGRLPVDPAAAVDAVFGPAGSRGSMVISGASGIVGAGKTMQFASRLLEFDVPVVALDMAGAPDGVGAKYDGLVAGFGRARADAIMASIVRLAYDGRTLPDELDALEPRFLLEAIPEILEVKRSHYALFRERYGDVAIRSVTSGFPAKELGVGVAHPAFPHEINKVFEIVEDEPSDVTRMLWALGLIPVPVSDDWSFILDVLFCGITLAGLRYHGATNMPYWKIDKFVRKHVGPNPFRAHDAIGAKGADFLTWSCLHHLSEEYGALFTPTADLVERKETGQNWYPPNHFRPLVDWALDADEELEFRAWILGPLFQMTTLMLEEERGHLTHMNAMGELCAQFRKGILATMREHGADGVRRTVERYHELVPEAEGSAWHPETLEAMDSPAWQQLYVNAEHDGTVGVVTLSRENYSWDVDAELNRALDWLLDAGIERVIVTGDFHLSTQMVGADTGEFFAAMEDPEGGLAITTAWARTARRLHDDFRTSVGFVGGKRCLGGMLELLMHCHHLVAVEEARFGWPEVTLPVVPGMEACHWPLRRADAAGRRRILELLLTGRPVKAGDALGWLVDRAGPVDEALQAAWALASASGTGDGGIDDGRRPVARGALDDIGDAVPTVPPADSPQMEAGREAIMQCVRAATEVDLDEALTVQARLAADFLAGPVCRKGVVGREYAKVMGV
jgi:enoyl-CoA hydratase/carnithine racemase